MTHLYFLAYKAYENVCKNRTPVKDAKGCIYPMIGFSYPSESLSKVGRKYVYLCNCNGMLAKYNIKTGEITI